MGFSLGEKDLEHFQYSSCRNDRKNSNHNEKYGISKLATTTLVTPLVIEIINMMTAILITTIVMFIIIVTRR